MTISGLDLLSQLEYRRRSLELNFGNRGGRVFFAAPWRGKYQSPAPKAQCLRTTAAHTPTCRLL